MRLASNFQVSLKTMSGDEVKEVSCAHDHNQLATVGVSEPGSIRSDTTLHLKRHLARMDSGVAKMLRGITRMTRNPKTKLNIMHGPTQQDTVWRCALLE